LLVRVLAIPPSQPGIELRQSHVFPVNVDSADQAPVAVDFLTVGLHLSVEREFRHVRATDVSESLAFLWSVDAGKADRVLRVVAVQYCNRVTVRDTDYATLE